MAKEEYYITVRTNPSGSEYTFKKVIGSKLSKEYFAYQSDVRGRGWSITDVASGISFKLGLPTLKACKDYLANISEEDLNRIEEFKHRAIYKKICQSLEEFKAKEANEFDQDFPEPDENK